MYEIIKRYYYPKYYEGSVWSGRVYVEHRNYYVRHVHHDDNVIIRQLDYDTSGVAYNESLTVNIGDSTYLLYEHIGTNYEDGYSVRYFTFSNLWGICLKKKLWYRKEF